MKYLLLDLLPKNLFSRFMGKLANIPFPTPFLQSFIKFYCSTYSISLDGVKTPLSEMKTFNQFFTREYFPEERPIDPDPNKVVSPVDGTIMEMGEIKEGMLVQTKGILYSLRDLVGGKHAKVFDEGYFLTVYLSPADYHRIHSPVEGTLSEFSYFSGNLWPVNKFGWENVSGLFSLNERIISPIDTEKNGKVALIKVGATIVGKIKVDYSTLESNEGKSSQFNLPVLPKKKFAKGDQVGVFQLGSTIILLFEKGQFIPNNLYKEQKLKMGEAIGSFAGNGQALPYKSSTQEHTSQENVSQENTESSQEKTEDLTQETVANSTQEESTL